MRKGISPVVAVVLLIAIAVIAAVGVWYWVGGLASKPAGAEYTQTALTVEACDGSSILLRNTGANAIEGNIPIYKNGVPVANVSVGDTEPESLAVGDAEYKTIVNSTGGQTSISGSGYKLIRGDLPTVPFGC